MDMKVFDSLHYGKENAIPSKALAKALGFQSVRDLQKQIERERAAGAVILSDPCGGGYYLSNDPHELRRFTRTLNARANYRYTKRLTTIISTERSPAELVDIDEATGGRIVEMAQGHTYCIEKKPGRNYRLRGVVMV